MTLTNKKLLADIDILVEEIKTLTQQIEEYKATYEERAARLTITLDEKVNATQANIEAKKAMVMALSSECDMKETKTQRSLDLLSGKVVIKKPKELVQRPTKEYTEHIRKYYPCYKKDKVVEDIDWAEMKKDLIIQDGVVIHKDTGETLDLEIKLESERLEIK